MQYPTIQMEVARQGLESQRRGIPWTGAPFVQWMGEGVRFAEQNADSLADALFALQQEFEVSALPSHQGKDFEGRASVIVHQRLRLEPVVAASREFWLWLTFVAAKGAFRELVEWRFGARSEIAEENYGLTTRAGIWEGLFARLWWRGNTGYDATDDPPYRVAAKGDIDLWRSHVIRQEYGRSRAVARTLVDFQYPDGSAKGRLKVKELREVVKRLRRVQASMSFELLAETDVRTLIEQYVEGIRESDRIDDTGNTGTGEVEAADHSNGR